MLQVGPELIKQVPKGGLGQLEDIHLLLIILVLLEKVLPAVLAGIAGPEVVGLVDQEGDRGPSGGLMEPLSGISPGKVCCRWAGSGWS